MLCSELLSWGFFLGVQGGVICLVPAIMFMSITILPIE